MRSKDKLYEGQSFGPARVCFRSLVYHIFVLLFSATIVVLSGAVRGKNVVGMRSAGVLPLRCILLIGLDNRSS